MDLGDGPMFPECSIVSFDNRTINSPPEPVAASTVQRPGTGQRHVEKRRALASVQNLPHSQMGNRIERAECPDPRGSFLDQWSLHVSPQDDCGTKNGPVAHISFGDHFGFTDMDWKSLQNNNNSPSDQPKMSEGSKGENKEVDRDRVAMADRSSLGILPSHLIEDASFGVDVERETELLHFGEENGRAVSQSDQSDKMQSLNSIDASSKHPTINSVDHSSKHSSMSSVDRSKDSWRGDSSNDRRLLGSRGIDTIKKRPAFERPPPSSTGPSAAQLMLALGQGQSNKLSDGENNNFDSEDAEPSICEVQFDDNELQDFDDEFSDLGEEDWFQFVHKAAPRHHTGDGQEEDNHYSPVSIAFGDDQCGIEDEECPEQGPMRHDSDLDTEDEVEAVRAAMRHSLGVSRQHGVGSSEEFEHDRSDNHHRTDSADGSNSYPEDFDQVDTRQSAEGEVVTSPYPGDGGGGGDGSSAPVSDDDLFVNNDDNQPQSQGYTDTHQNGDRIQPVGDETFGEGRPSMAASSADPGLFDSMYFKPATITHGGRESGMPLDGYGGLAEQSSYHFEDLIQSTHCVEQRLDASGMDNQQGRNPFSAEDSFCPQFDNSLGSFGASPQREEQEETTANQHEPDGFDRQLSPDCNSPQNVFLEPPPPSNPATGCKQYIAENSPVYLDENGVGVTDLAFQTSLAGEAACQQQALKEIQHAGADGFSPSDEFLDSETALNMLAEDEKKFAVENIFMKDDKMDISPVNPDDSWILKSSMYLSNSMVQTDIQRHGDACLRISIGQFMRSRSEALGSLGGDCNVDRPTFGSAITTPPSNRQPVKLIHGKEVIEEERSDGVGFDNNELHASTSDEGPLTLDDIDKAASPPSSSGYVSTIDDKQGKDNSQEHSQCLEPRYSDISEVSIADKTGVLSLSAITNIIASAPADCRTQDLVDRVLALSKAKALEGKSASSKAIDSNNLSSTSAKSKSQASKLPRRTSSTSSSPDARSRNQESNSCKTGNQKTVKGSLSSPVGRGQPVGSTEFKPDKTVTISKPVNHNFPSDEGSKTQPDGEEAEFLPQPALNPSGNKQRVDSVGEHVTENLNTPPTAQFKVVKATGDSPDWGTARLSIGHLHGNHSEQTTGSPLEHHVSTESPKEGNNRSNSPRLTDIAENMAIDLSKIEPSPNLTLSDSPGESTESDSNIPSVKVTKPSESKILGKSESNDGHVFKKPQAVFSKRASVAKGNSTTSGPPRRNESTRGLNTSNARQSTQMRAKPAMKKGTNKENNADSSKPRIRDKVLDSSHTGENILAQGNSRNKVVSRPQTKQSRNSPNNISKPQKTGEPNKSTPDVKQRRTQPHPPMKGTRLSSSKPQPISPSSQVSPSSSPQTDTQSPDYPHQSQALLQDDTSHHSETMGEDPTADLPYVQPSNHGEGKSQPHMVTFSDYRKDLLTPQHYNTHQCTPSNVETPLDYTNLDRQSILNCDLGIPAYHSTPFYHALSPCDNSDVADMVSPEKRVPDCMETKTPNMVRGVTRSPTLVDVPKDLRFVEVCCVGVSTKATLVLKNLCDHWLQVTLDFCQLYVNGQDSDHSLKLPFMFNQTTILEPRSVASVNVIFVPKYDGVYLGKLAVFGYPVSQNQRAIPESITPEYVTIQAVAERPNIKIICDNSSSLMFGEIYRGSRKGLPLTLVNNGKATVPTRLAITANNTSWHCFTFENTSSDDHSPVSGTHRPINPALNKSVLNLSLPGKTELGPGAVRTVTVYCQPPEREPSLDSWRISPDLIQAKIEIDVDTPSKKLPIAAVNLQAVVGEVKLQVPTNLEPITLISSGERATFTFSMKNAGNLGMKVKLRPVDFTEEFLVSPACLCVEPGKSEEVLVIFCPQSRRPLIETELSMFVEPCGPEFEAKLVGKFIMDPPKPVLPLVEILCSKNYINFGGIKVGTMGGQQLKLVHHSSHQLKLKLEIRCDQPDVFQIKSCMNQTDTLCSMKEVFVKPNEEYSVHLTFLPKNMSQVQGKLFVKQEGCAKKFSVPLSGYGGTKELVLEDMIEAPGGRSYWRNVGVIKAGVKTMQSITVWNTGSRAAFVKVLCFSDVRQSCVVDNNVLMVLPNEFIIKAGASKNLVLVLNPSSMQVSLCQEKRSVVGVLKFYFGDEVSRRLFRRCDRTEALPTSHPLSKVDFNVPLQGENDLEEGAESFQNSSQDFIMFYKGISRFVLSLTAEPSPPVRDVPKITDNQKDHMMNRNRLVGMSPVVKSDSSKYHSPENIQSTSRRLAGISPLVPSKSNKLSPPSHQVSHMVTTTTPPTPLTEKSSFEIYPQQVILDLSHGENCAGPVLVRNLSDVEISFDVCWPARRLNVDKDIGSIPPRGTCSLTISPSPQLLSDNIPLPWTAVVAVDTKVDRKEVSVIVRKGLEDTRKKSVNSSTPRVEEMKISNTLQPQRRSMDNNQAKIDSTKISNTTRSQRRSVDISRNVAAGKGYTSLPNTSTRSSGEDFGPNSNRKGCTSLPNTTSRPSSGDYSQNISAPVRSNSLPRQNQSVTKKQLPINNALQRTQSATKLTAPSSQTNPLPPNQPRTHRSLSASSADKKLVFTAASVGQTSETVLSLSNPSEQSLFWTLSHFTPPYLKPANGSGAVRRISYDVFKFIRTSGDLQPRETLQISVQFEPQDVGYFSQFWEVKKTEVETSKQTVEKLQLLAEALPASSPRVTSLQEHYKDNLDTTASSASTQKVSKSSHRNTEKKPVICLLDDTLQFSAWNTSQVEIVKAQIKNGDSVSHTFEIIPPQPPFYVNHTTLEISANHFVKLPFKFKPAKSGTFEGTALIKTERGDSLSLKLIGVCDSNNKNKTKNSS